MLVNIEPRDVGGLMGDQVPVPNSRPALKKSFSSKRLKKSSNCFGKKKEGLEKFGIYDQTYDRQMRIKKLMAACIVLLMCYFSLALHITTTKCLISFGLHYLFFREY